MKLLSNKLENILFFCFQEREYISEDDTEGESVCMSVCLCWLACLMPVRLPGRPFHIFNKIEAVVL